MTQRGLEWVMYTAAGLLSGAAAPMSIPNAIRAAAPRPELILAGGAVPDEPVGARWVPGRRPCLGAGLGGPRRRTHRRPGHQPGRLGGPGHHIPRYRTAPRRRLTKGWHLPQRALSKEEIDMTSEPRAAAAAPGQRGSC